MRPRNQVTGPEISDAELWACYQENPSSAKVGALIGMHPGAVRKRLAKIRTSLGLVVESADVDRAGKLEQLLASIPATAPGGGVLKSIDVKLYGIGAKNEETQEIVTKGMDSSGASYRFPVIQPLDVVPRKSPIKAYNPVGITDPKVKRIFIIGDLQLGFWAVRDPNDAKRFLLEPFQDEAAIDAMLIALSMYRPDVVVIVGDTFDFPQLSRFQQEPEWAQTLQATIQEGYDLFGKIRATVGDDCEIDWIPGNHEKRMTRAIVDRIPGMENLTKPGDKYPIYSVMNLMDFEDRNITPAAEYPSGEVWLEKRSGSSPGLVVTHADPARKEMRGDAIHGHLVSPSLKTRQVYYEDGATTYTTMCVSGCGNYGEGSSKFRLTRTNTPSGRARMDNIQSFGTVEIDKKTGLRSFNLHIIRDGAVRFLGKTIASKIPTAKP